MIDAEILRQFMGRSALVTGGTGLIGRQVVKILIDAGARVRTVSLDQLRAHPNADHAVGDLTDFSFCKAITKGADFVFHLAGIKGSVEVTKAKPASFFVPLLMMNSNILEACRVNGSAKVVYTSSIGAYANGEVLKEADDLDEAPPMDMYPGWAKRMAELQIRAYKIQYGLNNFATVRLCNVYGPGDNFDPKNAMVIPSLMARVLAGEDPLTIWGDGSAIRDFAYSKDVAEGVVLALHHGTDGGYLNLASGHGVSVREVVETLQRIVPFRPNFDASKNAGWPRRVMDITRARKQLGYNPTTSLEDGMRQTWAWYTQNQDEHLAKVNYFRD